ncbi:MAG: sulfurase [Oceanospirillaceae bacterium]|nr:sulfurase [Oceanospirillaceae bacterium]MBT10790.1 sulfurase [Oceanospirillaceae bacterium]|tara:strand:+ start:8944 stop:9456 length:513 start_codon:yes stop_codon:yes gene_type:complete
MTATQKLLARYVPSMQPGRVEWIGLRPERRQPVLVVDSANAVRDLGLAGDRRCEGSPGSARQVTLINAEHIAAIAALLQRDTIDPALLRRNIVVSGINLQALRYQQIEIGGALLELTAQCHPCSRMETALGSGGTAAMFMHGGLCARIIRSGEIRTGDSVRPILPQASLF